jgi:hypothetical protein
LVVDKDNKPANHGVIVERITPERYLCAFARLPAVSRIITLEQLMLYFLFPDDEQLNAFILSLTVPAEPKKPTKKKAKKKAKKKTTRRKSNGTR